MSCSWLFRGYFYILFTVIVGSSGGADTTEMAERMYYLPIPSCLFRPRLSRTGFLLSPTYPHFRLCEKMRGAGIMATRLSFCREAGPLGREMLAREQRSGQCHHSCTGHVASSHFQPHIVFINIKRKRFWLLRQQLYKTCRASLVAQWLRVCLPMQGTRVRALVWEDPTCRGATRPVSHTY